jgi:crotonobetainyl-CoA:carnitine CoA-transferase CaiB-like acyl-CoA transferase
MKLNGVKVLDLSRFLPGPYVTRLMADHGAEVLKVEALTGEPIRTIGAMAGGQSTYFRSTNRGKKSIAINLKSEQGKAIFLRLAESASVIIESFRPGVAARMGLDYEAIRKVNPGIVYCSISAFGQNTSLSHLPTHDLGVQAMFGGLALGKHVDGTPVTPGIPAADAAVAMTALTGILMALFRKAQTGEGDYIDASMADAVLSWTPHVTGEPFVHDREPDLNDDRIYGGAAFYRVYKTRDKKHIVLSGAEMEFVRNLLTALDRADLIDLCKKWGRQQQPVIDFLTQTFKQRNRDEWIAWADDKNVCMAPVLGIKEAYNHPYVQERGMIVRDADGHKYLGNPLRFRSEPGDDLPASPDLGQHTRDVLRGTGYSDKEIDLYLSQGIVGERAPEQAVKRN